ncbi:MAG: HU family DNA-binding protein, partial [Bifidobacterium choerinum]
MAYNKSDLVTKIAQKSHLTKAQAEAAVNAFQDVFVEAM